MVTCYVRVWIPNDPEEDWGFYDLFIEGTVKIKNQDFKDAVFAYGSDGKLYMYSESDTAKYYPVNSWAGYTAYRWRFDCDDTGTFEDGIDNAIKDLDSYNNGLVKWNIKPENRFASYSRKEVNSFAAVAFWCNWLGQPILLEEYNNAHNSAFEEYLPEAVAATSVADSWVETTMNGN